MYYYDNVFFLSHTQRKYKYTNKEIIKRSNNYLSGE